MKLSDYILLPKSERTKHIDLSSPCELGGFVKRQRGGCVSLFNLIGVTEDDIDNWTSARIHRCHACECGRRRGECGNPKHIYLGTAQENTIDIPKKTRLKRGKAMIGARTEWKTHPSRQRFIEDARANPELVKLSARVLAEMYECGRRTVNDWKKFV